MERPRAQGDSIFLSRLSAGFWLSWAGKQDQVVRGYLERRFWVEAVVAQEDEVPFNGIGRTLAADVYVELTRKIE